MDHFVSQNQIDDNFRGIFDSLNSHTDQIKGFNKKLANNKADTQLITGKNEEKLATFRNDLIDFKEKQIES